ncbi:hypothetical protein ON010_g16225 [Phytophthora cinnamomi]|nr:hypothetical protein ON010_g16225 [Phytophthora cinnamomi]
MSSHRGTFPDRHGDERGEIQRFLSKGEAPETLSRAQSGPVLVKSSKPVITTVSQARVHPCENSSQQCPKLKNHKGGHVKLRYGLAVLASICLLWTVWLILLTIAPNKTINDIMHTDNFDGGIFWLLVDSPPSLLGPTVVGFCLIALGYLVIIVQVLLPQNDHKKMDLFVRTLGSFDAMKAGLEKAIVGAAADRRRSRISSSVAKLAVSLSQAESPKRKFMNLGVKICDLLVEAILLFQVLEAGPPLLLVGILTTIITLNALSCIFMIFASTERTGFSETLLDLL